MAMKKNDSMQFTFDFGLDKCDQEKSSNVVAPPLAKKVLYLAHYIEAKEQDRNARLYKNIFDSIKHIR
jgi:hypothetical protein